jgi:hypothetical protein
MMESHLIAPVLAFTAANSWHPGIGDPTVIAWLAVAGYFSAAVLCWRLAFIVRTRAPVEFRKQLCAFWTSFAMLMTFLGVNKQLDLQTWLTQFGRQLAQDEGWYQYRRPVQAVFVLFVAIAGSVSLAFLIRLTKHTFRHTWIALTGGVFLGCFIMVRASAFHHVDTLLRTHFGGVKLNWVLELGGISWVVLGAWLNLRRLKNEG